MTTLKRMFPRPRVFEMAEEVSNTLKSTFPQILDQLPELMLLMCVPPLAVLLSVLFCLPVI